MRKGRTPELNLQQSLGKPLSSLGTVLIVAIPEFRTIFNLAGWLAGWSIYWDLHALVLGMDAPGPCVWEGSFLPVQCASSNCTRQCCYRLADTQCNSYEGLSLSSIEEDSRQSIPILAWTETDHLDDVICSTGRKSPTQLLLPNHFPRST